MCTLKKARGNCRGKLHDTILDWEDSLPERELQLSNKHCRKSDLCLSLGTSLQILPCGNMPLLTKRNKGNIVIVNLQTTKQDNKCDLKIQRYVDDVMRELCTQLGVELPEWHRPLVLLKSTLTLKSEKLPSIRVDAELATQDEHIKPVVKEEVGDMKRDINKTKTEISQTKTEIDETKTEIGQTKTEIDETKREIDETKREIDETKVDQIKTESEESNTAIDGTKAENNETKAANNETKTENAPTETEIDALNERDEIASDIDQTNADSNQTKRELDQEKTGSNDALTSRDATKSNSNQTKSEIGKTLKKAEGKSEQDGQKSQPEQTATDVAQKKSVGDRESVEMMVNGESVHSLDGPENTDSMGEGCVSVQQNESDGNQGLKRKMKEVLNCQERSGEVKGTCEAVCMDSGQPSDHRSAGDVVQDNSGHILNDSDSLLSNRSDLTQRAHLLQKNSGGEEDLILPNKLQKMA